MMKKEYSVGEATGVFYEYMLKSFIQSGNTDMVRLACSPCSPLAPQEAVR